MKTIIGRFNCSRNNLRSRSKDNLLIFGLILIGLMVIFSYGMGNVSAASGDSIYVNSASGNDTYNGLNSTWTSGINGPKATIKNATGTVTTNGTVHIASGTYNESNIQINTDMKIIGENQNNTIINARQSGSNIFTVATGVNLAIINLTLTNTTTTRGAILNHGTLTVNNSTFTNNNPPQNLQSQGSVIYSDGTLTVNNSTFTNNTATYGGVIYSYSGTLIVNNSTFTNNTASYGGAISSYDTLAVNNSTFTNNTAGYGGAIYTTSDTLLVNNSTFTNNTANFGSGGAILCSHTLTVNNCTFTNNAAITYGGAIKSNQGPMTVNNSTFTNNSATYGGAILSSGNLIVNNNIFTNNSASSYGGAIVNYGTAVVNFNRITGSTTSSSSAIYNSSGTLDARYNWWGSNTNPSANINGTGVTYSPWIVLTVTSNPTTIDVNGKSTITADLLQDSDGVYHDPVNGHVPDGLNVTFNCDTKGTVNPIISTITNGTTNTTFTGLQPGVSQVLTNVDAQTVTTNININTLPTVIIVYPIIGYKGDTITLTANLTDTHSNIPISGKTIQFTVNGKIIGTNETNSNGIATLPYTIQENSGIYTILAEFTGDTTYTTTNNTNTLTVISTPTAITINPINGYKGDTTTLTANLTDTHSNIPISGKTIQFTVNGKIIGTNETNSNGIATLPYTIQENSGIYTILAEFTGDTTYTTTNNTNTLKVTNVPTAKASPNGGLYNTTKSVTITMNEPGKIYYTINGTTPTNTSKLYTGPLTIKSTTTLKYLALDVLGNKSKVYSTTYTIDKKTPTVTVNVKSGLYNTTKTVKLTMNENGTIYYTLNGTSPSVNSKKYGGPIIIKSTTTLKYLAVDLAGNKSPAHTAKYTIDKTAPKVISTKPKNNSRGVSLTTVITIKFNEKISKTTKFSKIYIKNLTTGKITHTTTKLSGNTITIKMIRSRLSLNHYQIVIPTGSVKDTAGNKNTIHKINFKTSRY